MKVPWDDEALPIYATSVTNSRFRFRPLVGMLAVAGIALAVWTEPMADAQEPPRRIQGVVRQADGQPAVGIAIDAVIANSSDWASAFESRRTTSDGAFDLSVNQGSHELWIYSNRYSSCTVDAWQNREGRWEATFVTEDGDVTGVDITVGGAAGDSAVWTECIVDGSFSRLKGTATYDTGEPATRVWVEGQPYPDEPGESNGQWTASDGAFAVPVLDADYRLIVFGAGFNECTAFVQGNPRRHGESRVAVDGEDITNIRLTLHRASSESATWVACTNGVPPEMVTTVLRPGWNLAGWTGSAAAVDALFATLPPLEVAYAWNAEDQRFRLALRDDGNILGDLNTLEPNVGLWLFIGGHEAVAWERPIVAEAALVEAQAGWNLVAWGGSDGIAAADALEGSSDEFSEVWAWDARRQQLMRHEPDLPASAQPAQELSRGTAIWIHSSARTRWLQPGWVQPEVLLLEDVPAEEHSAIRAGWEAAQRFQAERYGVITSEFTAYVGEHYASIADSYRAHFGADIPFQQCATAGRKAIFIILSTCINSPFAHEYFHIVQQDLSANDYRGTPAWLYEGSADYIEHHQIQVLGVPQHYRTVVPQSLRERNRVSWSAVARPLTDYADQSLEYSKRRTLIYAVGFLAIERLVDEAGHESLVDYFGSLTSTGSWEESFLQAFGVSVDTFYADFEEHRLEVAPPLDWQIQGVVRSSDGEPVGGVELIALLHVDGDVQVTAWGSTDAGGTFDFPGPGTDYSLTIRALCDPYPLVVGGFGGEGFHSSFLDARPYTGAEQNRTGIVIELPMTLAEFESRYC